MAYVPPHRRVAGPAAAGAGPAPRRYKFVAVIPVFGRYVLLGSSGTWAIETVPDGPERVALFNDQRIPAPADTPEGLAQAKDEFERRANARHYNVGNIAWKAADANGPARYSARFLSRAHPNPPGFIKGTVDTDDVAVLRAHAIQEFYEEIGIQLPADRLTATPAPNVFIVDMMDVVEEKRDVIDHWRELKPFTELVELKWVPIPDVIEKPSRVRLNPQSDSVRQYVPSPAEGGRRPKPSTARRQRSRRSLRRVGGTRRQRRTRSSTY